MTININEIMQEQADISFEPVTGQVYYLYERDDHSYYLSPHEADEITWGRSPCTVCGSDRDYLTFISNVRQLADESWETA